MKYTKRRLNESTIHGHARHARTEDERAVRLDALQRQT
jgi:hypothetical protein